MTGEEWIAQAEELERKANRAGSPRRRSELLTKARAAYMMAAMIEIKGQDE